VTVTARSLSRASRSKRRQCRRGTLQHGRLADIVGFETDPITAPPETLRSLTPKFTLVGGQVLYDPDGLFYTDNNFAGHPA